VPVLQIYVVTLAEKYTPEAVGVASGLNIAAFNVGIALGSWAGAVIVLLALVLTRLSGRLDKQAQTVELNLAKQVM
jgi:DHA1 family inner membrane transport protein